MPFPPPPLDDVTRGRIRDALVEDRTDHDVTSLWTIPASAAAQAELLAKQHGVLAGMPIFREVFRLVDPEIEFHEWIEDGSLLEPGRRAARLSGSARSILAAERTALNLIGRFSGIATTTAEYVAAVAGTRARICDTRKTTPLWRTWEKYAVRIGGGTNHRADLAEMVLIKDNHAALLGGPAAAYRRVLESNDEGVPVEVEVQTLGELAELLDWKPERVLLDNMTPDQLAEAVRMNAGRAQLEASGGVDIDSVRAVAESGVDFISIGALTHSVRNVDFSLEIVLDSKY